VGYISTVLLAVLTVLVTVYGLAYFIQDRMFFYYVDSPEARENLQGKPGYSEVEFTAENGKTYHGMMYQPTDEIAPLVIYFGGNGECSYQRMDLLEANDRWQYYAGYNYLYVDYEGYGLNDGKTHYLNMYEEALAVFDYAASLPDVDTSRIVTMGYSLGTGCAVYLAANRPVAGLILAAPYAEGIDAYNSMLPIFYGPMKLLVKQRLPSYEYAPNVTCPALVIASRSDGMIPYSSSERLAKLLSGSLEFITLDNNDHNSLFPVDGVYDKIQSFLEGVASE
jgi:pimeloyl-ACP methyl ester carboxylesterase